MWEKILIVVLTLFTILLYALTVHLNKVLDDPVITETLNVQYTDF